MTQDTRARVNAGLARRRRRERVFRRIGALATAVGIGFLVVFLTTLVTRGHSAFSQTFVELEVELSPALLQPNGTYDVANADFDAVVRNALWRVFPEVTERADRRVLNRLVSVGASYRIRDLVEHDQSLIGTSQSLLVPASATLDLLVKGEIDRELPESQRAISDQQMQWIDQLAERGALQTRFNRNLFVNGDSREPELAGIRGALVGSLYMLLLTALVALPLGIAAAIYLEEFAPRNRWTDLIEVNINNLAAVPSIIFGLLGLAVFIEWLGMPRSAPLVGGLVLSLLTLPVIIIAARAAIGSVPRSIRDGALALGASPTQVVYDHVLPLAMPGILTGAIIGLSRALGETAPLLMIGMVAFIHDVPAGFGDPSTALPVQIYLWAESPERGFAAQTAAAIIVLLGFLLFMNLAAVIMRNRLERRL